MSMEPVSYRQSPNLRSALDARTGLGFHFEGRWPDASESERYASLRT